MRAVRFIFYSLAVVVGLVAGAAAVVWFFNPFAPPVVVTDPGSGGRRITENGLLANYFPPPDEGRHPGILLLGGSEGGIGAGTTRLAKALQAQGYAVLQPAYFRAPGMPERLELVPLELFDRALAWLKAQEEVDGERLAIVGGSKGAEAALILAARHPELRAVVAGMPSSVAWQGLDWNFLKMMANPPNGSWSFAGRPIPFLPYGQPKQYGGPIKDVYDAGLANLGRHQDAIIPIEEGDATVLLICGKADTLWPSCPMAEQVKARADAAGGPTVAILAYDNAGHGVFGVPVPKSNPNYDSLDTFGGTDDGNNAARMDAWPKVLQHLDMAFR